MQVDLTHSELRELEKLVKMVTRCFFEDEQIVVMDALLRANGIKIREEELVEQLKLEGKKVRQALQDLHRFHLVAYDHVANPRQNARSRNPTISYWYIEYRTLVNSLTLRFHKMSTRPAPKQAGLRCVKCSKLYEAFDAVRLFNRDTNQMDCQHCNGHLESYGDSGHDAFETSGEDDVRRQLGPLLDQLKICRGIDMPHDYPCPDRKERRRAAAATGAGAAAGGSGLHMRDIAELTGVTQVIFQHDAGEDDDEDDDEEDLDDDTRQKTQDWMALFQPAVPGEEGEEDESDEDDDDDYYSRYNNNNDDENEDENDENNNNDNDNEEEDEEEEDMQGGWGQTVEIHSKKRVRDDDDARQEEDDANNDGDDGENDGENEYNNQQERRKLARVEEEKTFWIDGVEKKLSEITEEDQSNMTQEQFEEYFRLTQQE